MLTTIVTVFIGIATVFLGLSLFASAIQEFLAQILNLRAKTLKAGIDQLLTSSSLAPLTDQIYKHPLIAGMSKSGRNPSYIPPQRFAQTLIDILKSQDALSDQTPGAVGALFRSVDGKVDQLEVQLAKFFDETMERVSGQYKRTSTLVLLSIGLVSAVAFNIDTIQVAETLASSPMLQEQMAIQAVDLYKSTNLDVPRTQDAAVKEIFFSYEQMQDLFIAKLKLGWQEPPKSFGEYLSQTREHLIGWLLTALGVSLGSGFWFNALGDALKLRATGPLPAKPPKATGTSNFR